MQVSFVLHLILSPYLFILITPRPKQVDFPFEGLSEFATGIFIPGRNGRTGADVATNQTAANSIQSLSSFCSSFTHLCAHRSDLSDLCMQIFDPNDEAEMPDRRSAFLPSFVLHSCSYFRGFYLWSNRVDRRGPLHSMTIVLHSCEILLIFYHPSSHLLPHSLCLFPYLSRVIAIRTDQSKVVRSVQILRFSQQLCIQNAHSDDRQITKKRLATLFIQILAKFTAWFFFNSRSKIKFLGIVCEEFFPI